MMATSTHQPHDREGESRAEPPTSSTGAYVRSLAALVALTLTSYWLSYRHLGPFEMPVALGIATLKVGVVALVFMGLVHERASSRVAGITAVLFVILLASLAAVDVVTR
jgi:cytochrome c oxidase subunit 4